MSDKNIQQQFKIGERVQVTLEGVITKVEGKYLDGRLRYSVSADHCINAFVTENEITARIVGDENE